MKKELLQKFNQLIYKTLNLSPQFDLTNARYGSPTNWDSIRHVELFIALQKEFKLSFSVDEIAQLNTYPMLLCAFLKKMED